MNQADQQHNLTNTKFSIAKYLQQQFILILDRVYCSDKNINAKSFYKIEK